MKEYERTRFYLLFDIKFMKIGALLTKLLELKENTFLTQPTQAQKIFNENFTLKIWCVLPGEQNWVTRSCSAKYFL